MPRATATRPRTRAGAQSSRARTRNNNRVADTREERPEERHALRDRRRARDGRVELLVRRRAQHHDARVADGEEVVRRINNSVVETVALASKYERRACGHEAEMPRRGGDG